MRGRESRRFDVFAAFLFVSTKPDLDTDLYVTLK